MADIAWRCVRASDGDVKYAERLEHAAKLEARGYVCELDPDADFDTLTLEPEQFPDDSA